MNTKVLEYILAIAEEKSVTRAAERFYLSHPALSRHLKHVEEDLGASLFTRRPGGMELTPAGVIFVNDARAVLQIENELQKDLAAMRHRKRKTIRVMVDVPLYNGFARKISPLFQATHPDFTLDVTTCNSVQARRALLDGTADLGLYYSSLQTAGLEQLIFNSTELVLCFPKDYRGDTGLSGLKTALDGGMFIILHPVGNTMRMIEEQHLAAHQIYPDRILEGDIQNSIHQVSKGQTCGLLYREFCAEAVKSQLTLGDVLCRVDRVIAYSSGKYMSFACQDLMQIVIREFSAGYV